MIWFQAILEKVISTKDKGYKIQFETQEMTGKEIAPLMDYNQSFVNVLVLPEDPEMVARLLKFLNAEKEKT